MAEKKEAERLRWVIIIKYDHHDHHRGHNDHHITHNNNQDDHHINHIQLIDCTKSWEDNSVNWDSPVRVLLIDHATGPILIVIPTYHHHIILIIIIIIIKTHKIILIQATTWIALLTRQEAIRQAEKERRMKYKKQATNKFLKRGQQLSVNLNDFDYNDVILPVLPQKAGNYQSIWIN